MKNLLLFWPFWALLSAGFAALTAIFAKVGVENYDRITNRQSRQRSNRF
jgi:uncharacterized membrane protein